MLGQEFLLLRKRRNWYTGLVMNEPPPLGLSPVIISRREWWLAALVAVLMALFALWTVLAGVRQTPPDQDYLYTNIPDVLDSQVYYAFIDQNARGRVLHSNLFTAESQRPVLFNPAWLVLGGGQRLFHAQPTTVFFAANVVAGIGLVLTIFFLVSHLFTGWWRWCCLVACLLSGGLGGAWVLFLLPGSSFITYLAQPEVVALLPADVTQPAGFVWSTLAHAPHYILSLTILLWLWLAVWKGWRPWWGPVATTVLGFIHPYDLVLLFGVIIGGLVLAFLLGTLSPTQARRQLLTMGWFAIGTVPVIVYYLWAMTAEPVLRQWYVQNVLNAPNVIALVFGYGPLLVLAALAYRRGLHRTEPGLLVATGWALTSLALLYFPGLPFQAKMISGLSIPLTLLAVAQARAFIQSSSIAMKRYRAAGLVILAIVGTMTSVVFTQRAVASQRVEKRYHYAPSALIQALRWVEQHSEPQAVVFGDVLTGNLVPQFAARATYLGHNIQTIGFAEKLQLTRQWFFTTGDEVEKKSAWLKTEGITFLVWGPYERRWGAFQPSTLPNLKLVFQADGVEVWQRIVD